MITNADPQGHPIAVALSVTELSLSSTVNSGESVVWPTVCTRRPLQVSRERLSMWLRYPHDLRLDTVVMPQSYREPMLHERHHESRRL
jgi:hypothetical protein